MTKTFEEVYDEKSKRFGVNVSFDNYIKGEFKDWTAPQPLPVVPEDVAKLHGFDDMKDYLIDERLLVIREVLNNLDKKSNNDITKAEAWCLTHEDTVYRAMLYGYIVEKPKTLVSPCPVCGYKDVSSNFCSICGHKNEYVEDEE